MSVHLDVAFIFIFFATHNKLMNKTQQITNQKHSELEPVSNSVRRIIKWQLIILVVLYQ